MVLSSVYSIAEKDWPVLYTILSSVYSIAEKYWPVLYTLEYITSTAVGFLISGMD